MRKLKKNEREKRHVGKEMAACDGRFVRGTHERKGEDIWEDDYYDEKRLCEGDGSMVTLADV